MLFLIIPKKKEKISAFFKTRHKKSSQRVSGGQWDDGGGEVIKGFCTNNVKKICSCERAVLSLQRKRGSTNLQKPKKG